MKTRTLVISSLALVQLGVPARQTTPPSKGHFVGKVVAEWLEDGRKMQLKEPFAYVDGSTKTWSVPPKTVVDGASIPRWLWTVVGSPFTGNYRDASVIHDYYCDVKTEKWEKVHNMFHEACLAGGTSPAQAKIMFMAVYAAGPRWEVKRMSGSNKNKLLVINKRASITDEKLTGLSQWITKTNPSLETIKDSLDKVTIFKIVPNAPGN